MLSKVLWTLTNNFRIRTFLSTDCVDTYTHSDVSADEDDYKAESWSLIVEHKFCKKQDKQTIKRQDVIYGKQTPE